jgi:hypothetical protein
MRSWRGMATLYRRAGLVSIVRSDPFYDPFYAGGLNRHPANLIKLGAESKRPLDRQFCDGRGIDVITSAGQRPARERDRAFVVGRALLVLPQFRR